MVEGEDVFGASALESVQVLHLEVILDPLQFEPWSIRHQSFQVRFVQQIVDSFLVYLQVRAVDRELLSACVRLLFDHFEKEPYTSRDDAFVLAGLHHGNRLPLLVLAILVTFHRERLSGARLAVRKNGRVVTL